MRTIWILGCALFLVVGLTSCGPGGGNAERDAQNAEADRQPTTPNPGQPGQAADGEPDATAMIEPTQGQSVRGSVEFREKDGGVLITAHLQGLTEGEHGIHVHEKGDCSAPDASSAGEHFAPGEPHGAPDAQEGQRHEGDLGNVMAGPDGSATYERMDNVIDLSSIIGKAVIVHAGRDDMQTQPSGNSGARIGCGVVARSAGGTGSTPTGG
jgi:Cu-Zn family superoxide dismutase